MAMRLSTWKVETIGETSYLRRFLCVSRLGWLADGATCLHCRFNIWCSNKDWQYIHYRIICWTDDEMFITADGSSRRDP
jgi:hypothetical protein